MDGLEERSVLEEIARRRQVSTDAVATALAALRRGGGTMAQLTHAEFGGMSQWSRGGMSMIGDMFNSATKARFDGVMADLSEAIASGKLGSPAERTGAADEWSESWWPAELGSPSTVGGQNETRYALFPGTRRLLVEEAGKRTIYDTGGHQISGVSQQQGSARTLTFSSQHGPVSLADLPVVG